MRKEIEINNHHFELHPLGGMFWNEMQMLLISDVHLGKVAHFRKHGSAVPINAIQKNFERLDEIVKAFDPKVVCFMGDLFHSALNKEWLLFEHWIASYPEIKFILVAGNHDIISPVKYEELDIHITDEWEIGSFLLTHHPEERDGCFNFAGHIHPGVELIGLGRQTLKVSCFFKKPKQLILPAFGEFTGRYILEPEGCDEVFAIAGDEIILISCTN